MTMARTTRTTISVPRDLKDRMDAVGVAVNWSAVACRAFERRVAEIEKRKAEDWREMSLALRGNTPLVMPYPWPSEYEWI
jgi:post-segregation antitoxin (ccd killing protein)